ncbi:MAG: hypothetical protein K8953_02145, partial [Proteobacteria bacterium]|nr:hypothetical protein [Pseudomonadota bacterium]
MTHSHKTIKNQHLTAQNYTRQNHPQLPRYFAIIPMILLATVFILTACGGKKAAITVNINLPVDPVVPVDCAADPFDTRCTAKQAVERIDFCRTGDNLQNPLCSIAISTICTSSGQYANPFDTTICKGYQLTAELEFLNNCSDTDTAARNGAACDAVMDCINNPFAASCNTDVYAERRELTLRFCNNAGNEDDPTCLGALTNCASANPNSNCGDLTNTYCTGAEGRTIAGDSSSCAARITAVCPTNPFAPVCTTDFVNSGFADANAVALAQQSFCQADNTNSNCTNLVKNFCDVATGDGIFDDLCDNVRERYNIARLESCIASDFAHSKCGVGFDRVRYDEINAICEDDGTDPTADICINFPNNFYSAYLICGDHTRTGTAPLTAFCQVDPSVFRTVRALCGSANTREVSDGVTTTTITTTLVGINPFHTICAEDVLNPDATADSRLEAQRGFCRQDVTNDLCPSTIATYCDALSGADLFDDLCDGDAYSADRIAHCDTAFVHDKCTATPDNIAQTLAICGTEASPGTNPFDPVCTEPTLTVNYSKATLDATRKRFCEGNLGNPLCEGTITLFCDYAKGDDIFDDLCNGADYTGARL